MLEILATIGGIIVITSLLPRIWRKWKKLPSEHTYTIQFLIGDKPGMVIEKKYINNDAYDFDEWQLVEIATDPVKNAHLRLSGITEISIRNIDLDYQLMSIMLRKPLE
jgi:hypothetical protein